MTILEVFAVVGVSVALAALFKYGFQYLSDRMFAQVMEIAADDLIENYREELIKAITEEVINHIEIREKENVKN